MKIEDENIVYVQEDDNNKLWRLFKLTSKNSSVIYYCNVKANAFWTESINNYLDLRLATPEESHYMNEMIKANKFIPYEEAMKTFKEESLVGRYAKFKSNWNTLGNYHCYNPIDFNKAYKIDCIGNYKFKNCSGKCVIINEIYEDAYIPVEVLDIMPEGWTPEQEKPQYEVGKWYKTSKNSYVKFSKLDETYFYGSEYIHYEKGYKNEEGFFRYTEPEDIFTLTNLNEIQQYLPDGHIDKFPIESEKPKYEVIHCTTQEEWNFVLTKDNPFKRLKVSEEQWKTYGKNSVIFINHSRWTKTALDWAKSHNAKIYSFQEWCDKFGYKPDFMSKKEEYKVGSYVVVHNLAKISSNAQIGSLAIITRQPYNADYFINNVGIDVKWINLKDKNGNSIPLNQQNDGGYSLNMFRLALPHEIPQEINNFVPEYVECISKSDNQHITIGKIYKVIPYTNYWKVIHDKGSVGTYKLEKFKLSTKEAFENQQKSLLSVGTQYKKVSNSDVIEIGDEIELLTSNFHNSCSKWYNHKIAFKQEDIGSKLIILDYEDIDGGAYKVETPRGYTALRKSAFKLIKKASQTTLLNKKVDGISPVKVNTKLLDIIKIKGSTPTKVEKKRIKLTILKTKQLNLN